jgi:hypothetical protein
VHPPSEEKNDESKDCFFYEELEKVFDDFLKYHMEILLGDFSTSRQFGMGVYHVYQASKDSVVGIVNFATSRNLVVKSGCSGTETFICIPEPLLMGRLTARLITH